MGSSTLFWAFLVVLVGFALVVAEVFIPSGGVLGLGAAAALCIGVVMAFLEDRQIGTYFLFGVPIVTVALIAFSFHILPKTAFGRRIFLAGPTEEDIDPTTAVDRKLQELVGEVGRTLTQLRPAGLTEIAGQRVDTLSEGIVIEPGTLVRVVEVQGHRVTVRIVDSTEASA